MLHLPSVTDTAVEKFKGTLKIFLSAFSKQLKINTSTPKEESKCIYLFNVYFASNY